MIGNLIIFLDSERKSQEGMVIDKVRTVQQFGASHFEVDAYVVRRSSNVIPNASSTNIIYPYQIVNVKPQ